MSIQEQLEKLYQFKVKASFGVPPTVAQLLQLAIAKKITGITKSTVSKFLKSKILHAQFSHAKKPKFFQTVSFPRAGIFFLDYAEFHKNHALPFNKGHTGFLVCVENLTNKLFVFPCKGKATKEWESAVQLLIQATGYIRTIYTDRDSVATSAAFQKNITDKYNVCWYYLKRNSKSFLAERYIRYVKERLSQALSLSQTHNWIQFIPSIVKDYNDEIVPGTRYKRRSINPSNFNEFLTQLLKLKHDPDLLLNRTRLGAFKNPNWNKALFSFQLGDKVLIARKSNWQDPLKNGPFFKPSHYGSFAPTIYTISGRQLRATKGFKKYVAVYSLANFNNVDKDINTDHRQRTPTTWFYEEELQKVF